MISSTKITHSDMVANTSGWAARVEKIKKLGVVVSMDVWLIVCLFVCLLVGLYGGWFVCLCVCLFVCLLG